jgi:hypothetical protein
MTTSEVLVVFGAALSALAGVLVFSLDQFRDQTGAQEKIVRKQEGKSKPADGAGSPIPDAAKKAENRVKLERFFFAGLPLLLAVGANVVALFVS